MASLSDAALAMAQELQANRLSVSLVPAPIRKHAGHKVRVVEQRNPDWYRELCAEHPKNRSAPRQRHPKYTDSLITRRETILALLRIFKGDHEGVYAERLLPYVKAYAEWMKAETHKDFMEWSQ